MRARTEVAGSQLGSQPVCQKTWPNPAHTLTIHCCASAEVMAGKGGPYKAHPVLSLAHAVPVCSPLASWGSCQTVLTGVCRRTTSRSYNRCPLPSKKELSVHESKSAVGCAFAAHLGHFSRFMFESRTQAVKLHSSRAASMPRFSANTSPLSEH